MRRDEIPEDDVVSEAELGEDPLHDRRACLGGPAPGELPLGREGDSAYTSTSVAGRFPYQEDGGRTALRQIDSKAATPHLGSPAFAIEVESRPDARAGEALDQSLHRLPQDA